MSAITGIEQIIHPSIISNFREGMYPVRCIIWKGGSETEEIIFDRVYPFDTIDNVKQMISSHYKGRYEFLPKYTFVATKVSEENDEGELYMPVDYNWFPTGSSAGRDVIILPNPRTNVQTPSSKFITSDGSFPSITPKARGRSTLEKVYLQPFNEIPTFYVFPLLYLMRDYNGPRPISEADWNKRFAPYFIDIPVSGPYEATEEDKEFANTIYKYIESRSNNIDKVNEMLEYGYPIPIINVTGVKYIRLGLQVPEQGFDGCESLFYRLKVTERRPFIRLIPANGSAVSKVHVKGVLPIPSLDHPELLLQWASENNPIPSQDYCYIKYLHRSAIGSFPNLYGTIRITANGGADIVLQPPKGIRKLEPGYDFSNFGIVMEQALKDMPHKIDEFKLNEVSLMFSFKADIRSPKFTKQRLLSRLPYFQAFFQQIKSLPGEQTIISLRYKAVSEYASEDKYFTFITQYATDNLIEGDEMPSDIVDRLEKEFQITEKEAKKYLAKWIEQRGTYTIVSPEEGEFAESYNPGIDIHIYAQHPFYNFHANRIDSYETFQRIYTLLGLMFQEDDNVFGDINTNEKQAMSYSILEQAVEEEVEEREGQGYGFEPGEVTDVTRTGETSRSAVGEDAGINATSDEMNGLEGIDEEMMAMLMAESAIMESFTTNPAKPPSELPSGKLQSKEPSKKPLTTIKEEQPLIQLPPTKSTAPVKKEELMVNPHYWFINKLKEIDPRLFSKSLDGKDKSGDNGYSRICQASDDRQPAVMTQAQYDRMLEEYEDDIAQNKVIFMMYPLEGKTNPPRPHPGAEVFNVLKFGTDPTNQSYYVCSEYYCLYDEIIVRKRDFEGTKDRDNNPKPPNSCPFCKGLLITEKVKPVLGYTVIRRKAKGEAAHTYIGFTSKTTQKDGFKFPCCFKSSKVLRRADDGFDHIRIYEEEQQKIISELMTEDTTEIKEEENDDVISEAATAITKATTGTIMRGKLKPIEFTVLFETMKDAYILGPEKHPLDPGKLAVSPPPFERYFAQDSKDIVERITVQQKIKPVSRGFIRIGTDNSKKESILGIIAPLMYKNTIEEVRERLLEFCSPRVFISANFGNLVNEFFSPSDPEPTINALKKWASENVQIDLNSENTVALSRIKRAYERYRLFLSDPTQRKDLRHIAPLLAEPGLASENGILIVVMDWNPNDPSQDVNIRCPIYGVSLDRHKKADITFVSRDPNGIFELFVYTINSLPRGGERGINDAIIRWSPTDKLEWPEIVRSRVNEFLNQCQSRYRTLFTSQQGIDQMAMISLSKAVQVAPLYPAGVVRDSYNHAVALTFRLRPGKAVDVPLITLPIVDDGLLTAQLRVHLDWDDYPAAPADAIIKYYSDTFTDIISMYPGYKPKHLVRYRGDPDIIAVQLENGIYIPASNPGVGISELGISIVEVEELEWSINKALQGKCGVDPQTRKTVTMNQINELYQHFRLSVSNWLASEEAGPNARKSIEEVIFNSKLPDYEKRKRLDILLAGTLQKWFLESEEEWEIPNVFLRRDCRLIDSEESCSGVCKWKENKCYLHVNPLTKLGSDHDVSTTELFIQRVIDELVRFYNRRKEILQRKVSEIAAITDPIRYGDKNDQYIIPESSPTWLNLLRMDWSGTIPEKPKFYEEMSRKRDEVEPSEERSEAIPPELEDVIGAGTSLRLWIPPNRVNKVGIEETKENTSYTDLDFLFDYIGVSREELGISPTAKTLTRKDYINIIKKTGVPLGEVNLLKQDPTIDFYRPFGEDIDNSLVLVFMSDGRIGLLVENPDNPYLYVSSFPVTLDDAWNMATRIRYIAPGTEQVATKGGRIPLRISRRV
jgi:hypothetical protein